ncbi:MAG: molybdenum cofactor biosynthesis protein [Bryobacteraceae bacterium]
MRVRVLFFGILKDIVGRSEESLEIEPNSTLASLFEAYSMRFETLRDKRPSILFARNREFATPGTSLTENDEVAFLPPVSGGSEARICTPEGHVFAITRDALDSEELSRRLQSPDDGALVIFEGVVRNHTNGRLVRHLEYECYEQMALEQIVRIGSEVAAKFSLGRIGMVHRLGRLAIGEASVVVVVAAPHRKAAFEAALEGINRLKREVPIWKKEFFADGAVWVDGEWDDALLAGSRKDDAP